MGRELTELQSNMGWPCYVAQRKCRFFNFCPSSVCVCVQTCSVGSLIVVAGVRCDSGVVVTEQ